MLVIKYGYYIWRLKVRFWGVAVHILNPAPFFVMLSSWLADLVLTKEVEPGPSFSMWCCPGPPEPIRIR